jgi:hypothetical protein
MLVTGLVLFTAVALIAASAFASLIMLTATTRPTDPTLRT